MKTKTFITGLNYVLNYAGILALVAIPVYFGYLKQPTEMGILVGAISLALFFLNLDKFSKFSGAGMSAELRIVTEEAYATLEELRKLAVALSTPIVNNLTLVGRMTSDPTNTPKFAQVAIIVTSLRALKVPENEIAQVCYALTELALSDIVSWLKQANKDKEELFNTIKLSEWNANGIEKLIKENKLIASDEAVKQLAYLKKIQEP